MKRIRKLTLSIGGTIANAYTISALIQFTTANWWSVPTVVLLLICEAILIGATIVILSE